MFIDKIKWINLDDKLIIKNDINKDIIILFQDKN